MGVIEGATAAAGSRVLVTGATGFVGRHVVAHLTSIGAEVAGLSRSASPFAVDLAEPTEVKRVLRDLAPTHILHLAGAIPAAPGGIPGLFRSNVLGTSVLLREAALAVPGARIILLSSSAVYGRAPTPVVDELLPVAPVNPYGLSKAAGEELALQSRAQGQEVCVVRGFNLSGPGLPPGLVLSDVAAQVVAGGVVRVGNVDSRRDWLDVRDMATALGQLLFDAPSFDVVNVGAGESVLVGDCVDRLVALGGGAVVENDEARRQAADIPDQVAGLDRLRALLPGWRPARSLDESLGDVLADWQERSRFLPPR